MSNWTHVYGVIEVDTLSRTTEEAMYWTQIIVNHLPKVYGAEIFTDENELPIYLNTLKGYNCSSNADELNRNFKWRQTNELYTHQSKVAITIDGDLRNKRFDETLKEVVKMLSKLGERTMVYECLVRVQDDYGRKVIIDNPDWVINAEPTFWLEKYIKERYHTDECTIYF